MGTGVGWLHLILEVPRHRSDDAVRFWADAAGAAPSLPAGERDQLVTLLPALGSPWVMVQTLDEPNHQPGARVHLGIDSIDRIDRIDRSAAAERSTAAGAPLAWAQQDVAVMRSPGGLPFCPTLVDPHHPARLHRGDTNVVLDQVCLDIPSRWWDIEVAFWQALTGRDLERGLRPEFAFLGDREDPAGTPRILLQQLGDDAPSVSAHPDFATNDKQGQARRHVALGATIVAEYPRWTVLQAPSGHRYCLTDRDPATGSVHRSSPAT